MKNERPPYQRLFSSLDTEIYNISEESVYQKVALWKPEKGEKLLHIYTLSFNLSIFSYIAIVQIQFFLNCILSIYSAFQSHFHVNIQLLKLF